MSASMRRRLKLKRSKCINNDGSYTCDCFPGYDKAGEQCFDINECDDTVWQGMAQYAESPEISHFTLIDNPFFYYN